MSKPFHQLMFIGGQLALLAVVILASIATGEANIPVSQIPEIVRTGEGTEYFILTQIRLPRIVLAFAVGGALSLSGAILQGVFRNPLVEPYTLGISGGAAFGVALAIVGGLHLTGVGYMLPLAGFAGAAVTIFLVGILGFLRGGADITRMLLIGVMISFVASSSMMFLMSVTTAENLHGIIFWIMGSLDEPNHHLIKVATITSIIGLAGSYLFVNQLNALQLGKNKATHLGINTTFSVRILFIVASLLTGVCVSVAGVIGFVGLAVPHIIRLMTGGDHRLLLVSSFLGGSIFLIACDILARTVISPNELPIGVITGIIGGFVFMIVLNKSRIQKEHHGK